MDLQNKELRTTEASGERRETPVRFLEKSEGLISLQGVEAGRAFSLVIVERSGALSAAVAREETTVSVFGSCTPLPRSREEK